MYEEKMEDLPAPVSIMRRINVSSKKSSIFDSNGVLLIGSHKIVKKKPIETTNFHKRLSILNSIAENSEPNNVPITKRIHK